VQVIPHITDEIKHRIQILGETGDYDIVITEIGGTVGDIESLPYIESVRQLLWEKGNDNAIVIHLTLIPYLAAAGELKTKPTQHSVKMLMQSGVSPDILVCRTEHQISDDIRKKLALFCNVKQEDVIQSIDAETIYDVPNLMLDEGLDTVVLKKLNLVSEKEPELKVWNAFLQKHKNPKFEVEIALIGKYIELQDSYKSISEAFIHAGSSHETKVNVRWIHSESLTPENFEKELQGVNGILVAPGFGDRGIDGKIKAVQYARENKIPFFGICLGMQMAVIEFSKNVLGLKDAFSTEMKSECLNPVIHLMESQENVTEKGGTMRLGAWKCEVAKDSKTYNAYQSELISERHRHRYEFNSGYLAQIEAKGMKAAGTNPETGLVEIVEIPTHPWFVGVQYHPEYKSTVLKPHPLFVDFIKAALKQSKK
jgi:CTP synthase